jgi:hypothetical protein
MITKLGEILGSTRFWALIGGCITILAEGNFTADAWAKALVSFFGGFILIRTADKFAK